MSKPKILYVDDEHINVLLFAANLDKKYTVLTAYDGKSGLDVLAKNKDILVVISDMKMPMMDGLEFINKAKEISPKIHYYILTGFDVSDEILKSINDGEVRRYFQKPFNMKEISAEIERVISG
jgi:two-component system, response regulator, stage 0 sporulation protein F